MYEVEYNSSTSDKKVVLFYYDWFDSSWRGTKVDTKYDIVDIWIDKRYMSSYAFIFAYNVRQVYYVPYPSSCTNKCGWSVTIKTKPRVCIDSDDV